MCAADSRRPRAACLQRAVSKGPRSPAAPFATRKAASTLASKCRPGGRDRWANSAALSSQRAMATEREMVCCQACRVTPSATRSSSKVGSWVRLQTAVHAGKRGLFFFSFFNNYFMIFAKIYLSIMLFGLFLLNNCDYLMIIWYQAICRLKRLKLLRLVQVKLLQRRVVVVVVAAMGPARDQALCQSLCPALARRGGYAAARARGGSRCPVRSTNSPSCPAAESAPARSSPLTLCDTVQRAHKHST